MKNYILKDENAVYYECGYSCDNEIFLKLGSESFFITDGRYTLDAKENIKNAVVIEAKDLIKEARKLLRKSRIKKLFFDPKEFNKKEIDEIEKSGVFLKEAPNFSWKKRVVKTEEEIKNIKKSVKENNQAFERFKDYLLKEGVGKSEKRIHFEAVAILSSFGQRDLSFDPIFAINENAAKPHAHPSSKKLKNNDLILFDAGVKYKRYCSDRTRTAYFDKNLNFGYLQKFSKRKIQKAYDTVLKAHDEAIKRARAGMKAKDIDKIARDIIDKSEFKGFFVHSLGHGVGLDIHEMPFISQRSETVIEENMVFTIEPGIYIPDEFGIRIEDMVVIKNGRAEILE